MAVAQTSSRAHLEKYHSWNSLTDEVLCLLISREQNILTGHESKVNVWSWDSKLKAARETIEVEVEGSVTCIRQFPHSSAFAVSVNQNVLIYQYQLVDAVITSLSLKNQLCFNHEEINQIDIHPKGSFICSCDDNGEVKIIDIDNKKIKHTLTNFHDGICATVKFSAKKPWELLSGGLDCAIGRWDFNRGRLLAKLCTRNEDTSSVALMVNPPMVHSLDVFSSHHGFICGLGDGRLVAYSLKAPKGIDFMCHTQAHTNSVACVHCIELTVANITVLYVVSVGNDGVMCIHELQSEGGQSFDIILVDKMCSIPKVNDIDVLIEADTAFIFAADVSGSVSVYTFKC